MLINLFEITLVFNRKTASKAHSGASRTDPE